MATQQGEKPERYQTSQVMAGLRVLIAEPDATIRQSAKTALMRSGFARILEAPTFKEAVEKLRTQRPHLVITNVDLAGGSGAMLLQGARRQEESEDLPFVLLAADRSDPVAQKAAELRRCRLVRVPFVAEELLDAVAAVLDTAVSENPPEHEAPGIAGAASSDSATRLLAIASEHEPSGDEARKLITLPGHERLRVLLVDGNAIHRAQIAESLHALGFEHVTAIDSTATALKRIESGREDLVLCECFPSETGPSGFDLLRAVRANEVTNSIPVVMLTTIAESDAVVRALRLKADDYLLKPLPLRSLANSLNRIFAQEEENRRTGNTYKGICLDDAAAVATAAQLVRNASTGRRDGTTELDSLRILLVDEDEKFRCVCGTLLRRMGFQKILETTSGASATRKLEHGRVDLVFCEWSVVGVSGLEILRSIRAIDFLRGVPFVMLTEVSTKEHVLSALRAGVTDYIVKPCSIESLAESLSAILIERRSVRSSGEAEGRVAGASL